MDGACDQFFTSPTLSSNENAARLRSNGLDHVEDGAHFRALADDVVEPGEPADFAPQIAGLFLPLEVFRHLTHGKAQLVD